MARSRTQTLLSLLKGLAGAILLTLLLMAAVAALAAMGRISDGLLMALNQLMKKQQEAMSTYLEILQERIKLEQEAQGE